MIRECDLFCAQIHGNSNISIFPFISGMSAPPSVNMESLFWVQTNHSSHVFFLLSFLIVSQFNPFDRAIQNHPRAYGAERFSPHLWSIYWIHPRAYGVDSLRNLVWKLRKGPSPRIGGRFTEKCLNSEFQRLIPVYTGQILNFSSRFLLLASRFPSSWTSATESVCIILDWYIFADNTFWSILVRNDIF